jgi:RNA polymerase sigma-70 factor (ECF subfamily)
MPQQHRNDISVNDLRYHVQIPSLPHSQQASMNSTEPPSVTDASEGVSAPSSPSLPMRVQKHLGALLTGIYSLETVEPGRTNRFDDLLAKLEHALGQARDRNDVECRQLLLAAAPALRRFALSLAQDSTSADDLVQDTLLRAWQNRASFTPGTNFEAWTFTILRNQFYTCRRKHREVQDEEGVHAARLVSLPDQTAHLDLQDVQAAVSRLPPVMREALVLVTVEDLSYEEAAAIMNCEIGTAKSRVWRARDRLARLLGFGGSEFGNDPVMLSAFPVPTRADA